ncbi:MAG: hypothetical protein V4697_01635 [Patescibacteria group bacterium]
MKYSKFNMGEMEAVLNKLGGMAGLQKLLDGKLRVVHAGHQIWNNLVVSASTPHGFEMYEALQQAGVELSEGCFKAVNNSARPDTDTYFMVAMKTKDFGFNRGANSRDVMAQASLWGFKKVPNIVAPAIALLLKEKKLTGKFTVATEPMAYSGMYQVESTGKKVMLSVLPVDGLFNGSSAPNDVWLFDAPSI